MLEEFRAYLEEKTGKRVQQVKGERPPGVTWLLGIGVSVLAIAVLAGATFGRKAIENRPVVFSQGGDSITLPAGFWQVTNDHIPWFISQAGDASVWAEWQEAGPLYEAWGTPLTDKELVQNMNEGLEEEIAFYDLNNGAACYTFSYGEGGDKSFYFEAVMKSEDVFWFTEFECAQEIAPVYREQFLQWARPSPLRRSLRRNGLRGNRKVLPAAFLCRLSGLDERMLKSLAIIFLSPGA